MQRRIEAYSFGAFSPIEECREKYGNPSGAGTSIEEEASSKTLGPRIYVRISVLTYQNIFFTAMQMVQTDEGAWICRREWRTVLRGGRRIPQSRSILDHELVQV